MSDLKHDESMKEVQQAIQKIFNDINYDKIVTMEDLNESYEETKKNNYERNTDARPGSKIPSLTSCKLPKN